MEIEKLVIRAARVEDAAGVIAFRQEVTMEPGIGIATDPGEFQYTVEQAEANKKANIKPPLEEGTGT